MEREQRFQLFTLQFEHPLIRHQSARMVLLSIVKLFGDYLHSLQRCLKALVVQS